MVDTVDYQKILAELVEERADLERMISWVQSKIGRVDADPPSVPTHRTNGSVPATPMRFPRLRSDAFFKMTVQEAIREFLSISKRPQSARTITNALEEGGLTHKAKDLYQTVFPTLLRMKEKGEVDKLPDGDWGLSEWYGPRKSNQDEKEESNT